jgi:predicted Zn-dependent protease
VATQVERLLEVGRPSEARRLLAPALRERPDDPELLVLAARVEGASGAGAEARRLVGEALARDPRSFVGRLLHYGHLVADQRHADAEGVILELLREQPRNAALLVLYARLMLDALQLEKARALADEALRLAPDSSDARIVDTLLHVIAGDDERASARLAELIAEEPEASHVAWTAVLVLSNGHRPREALEVARSLLRATPGDPRIVETIVELRIQTHPLMLPYRPLQRWGWTASAVLWGAGVVGVRALAAVSPAAGLSFGGVWLAYVVGSWLVPPLLRRALRRMGA